MKRAVDFRDHAARNDALFLERTDVLRREDGDERIGILHVAHESIDVGHQHEAARAERAGNRCGRRVGIDVVASALAVTGYGRDDGNASLFEKRLDNRDVDARDVPHETEILRFGSCGDETCVKSAQSHGLRALGAQELDEVLVRLACEHALHDAHRLLVGDAKSAHEIRFDPKGGERLVDGGTAAVNEYDADADHREEHQVVHHLLLQLGVLHGVSAVLHHDGVAAVEPDVLE